MCFLLREDWFSLFVGKTGWFHEQKVFCCVFMFNNRKLEMEIEMIKSWLFEVRSFSKPPTVLNGT